MKGPEKKVKSASMGRSSDIREPDVLIKMFRMRPRPGKHRKLTQNELAALVGRDPRALREWESGVRLPQPESLIRLIQAFMDEGIFIPGKEQEEAKQLWEAVRLSYDSRSDTLRRYPPFDERWMQYRADLSTGKVALDCSGAA